MNKCKKSLLGILLFAILIVSLNSPALAAESQTIYYELPLVRNLRVDTVISISDVTYQTRYGLEEIMNWDAWTSTYDKNEWWDNWRDRFIKHLNDYGDIPVFYTNANATLTLPDFGIFSGTTWASAQDNVDANFNWVMEAEGTFAIYWLIWYGFTGAHHMITGTANFTEPGTYLIYIPSIANHFYVIGLVVH